MELKNHTDIFPDAATLRKIESCFGSATGLGVVFADTNGNHVGCGSNFCAFCQKINASKEGRNLCFKTNRTAAKKAMVKNKPLIYFCHAGLIDIEIPLIINDCFVGSLMAGQIRCEDCQKEDFPQMIPQSKEFPWFTSQEFSSLKTQTLAMPKKRIIAMADNLFFLANYIVEKNLSETLERKLLKKQELLFEEEKKRMMLENNLKLAKLNALQQQINPHFMFNILSTISRLIDLEQIQTAQNVLDTFSKMLRYSLHNESNIVTLRQELSYLEKYLYLQHFRFNNRINYTIEVDPALYDLPIPFFALQVFVENSIVHGLEPKTGNGILKIKGENLKNTFHITIEDNGIGMSPKELQDFLKNSSTRSSYLLDYAGRESHFGVSNSLQRLKIHFGKNLNFSVVSEKNKGTKVLLKIKKHWLLGNEK